MGVNNGEQKASHRSLQCRRFLGARMFINVLLAKP